MEGEWVGGICAGRGDNPSPVPGLRSGASWGNLLQVIITAIDQGKSPLVGHHPLVAAEARGNACHSFCATRLHTRCGRLPPSLLSLTWERGRLHSLLLGSHHGGESPGHRPSGPLVHCCLLCPSFCLGRVRQPREPTSPRPSPSETRPARAWAPLETSSQLDLAAWQQHAHRGRTHRQGRPRRSDQAEQVHRRARPSKPLLLWRLAGGTEQHHRRQPGNGLQPNRCSCRRRRGRKHCRVGQHDISGQAPDQLLLDGQHGPEWHLPLCPGRVPSLAQCQGLRRCRGWLDRRYRCHQRCHHGRQPMWSRVREQLDAVRRGVLPARNLSRQQLHRPVLLYAVYRRRRSHFPPKSTVRDW